MPFQLFSFFFFSFFFFGGGGVVGFCRVFGLLVGSRDSVAPVSQIQQTLCLLFCTASFSTHSSPSATCPPRLLSFPSATYFPQLLRTHSRLSSHFFVYQLHDLTGEVPPMEPGAWVPFLQQPVVFDETVTTSLELCCHTATPLRAAVELRILNRRTGALLDVVNGRTAAVEFEAHAEGYEILAAASAQAKTEVPLPWRLRILSARDFPACEPHVPLPTAKTLMAPLNEEDEQQFQ